MGTSLAQLTDADFSREKIELIKRTIAVGATDDELSLFLYTCKRTGLDPLARQIYAIKRSGKMAIQTGIDGYRVIADRTGKLAGISDYSFDSEEEKFPKKASVTVRKLVEGTIAEFTATARWSEYTAGGPMWAKMPYLMLGKCAEALALRKAFPADLSGVYTSEEMAQADNEQQRDAVYAEVERQKAGHAEPELDWSWNEKTGVLICRIKDAKKTAKKKGGGTLVTVQFNNSIDGRDKAFYFHTSHEADLLGAVGKVVKLIVVKSGEFLNIEDVLEVDGKHMEKAEAGNPETDARLLASAMEFTEEDVMTLLNKYSGGNWSDALSKLQAEKHRRETEVSDATE